MTCEIRTIPQFGLIRQISCPWKPNVFETERWWKDIDYTYPVRTIIRVNPERRGLDEQDQVHEDEARVDSSRFDHHPEQWREGVGIQEATALPFDLPDAVRKQAYVRQVNM